MESELNCVNLVDGSFYYVYSKHALYYSAHVINTCINIK